jgi:hypothetical protein
MNDFSSAEVSLMKKIHEKWSPMLYAAAHTTTVTEMFLAALVAGESAGDPAAKRFEPAVFGHLLEVCLGKRASFSVPGIHRPLGAVDMLGYISKAGTGTSFLDELRNAADLATSFGLTQIMGWHLVELFQEDKLEKMKTDPLTQLDLTIQVLVIFANKYDLNLTTENEALFTCWNTGEPDGHTYDPNYVPNGLRRMAIYQQISAAPPAVTQ